MGIFGRNIKQHYGAQTATPLAISSPWAPADPLMQLVVDDALKDVLTSNGAVTRDVALRVPGVDRAHGIAVSMLARTPFYVMNNDERHTLQPAWLTNSASGVAPYHRMYGLGSDLFFNGWGCLGFTADMSDCMHVPYGLWSVNDAGVVIVDDDPRVPERYRARPVAIPLGYGENGLLVNGADTIRQARKVENAYNDRLDNPIPLTILGIPRDVWEAWSHEERQYYRDQWVAGRKNGGVAMKVADFPVEMPGQTATDLYESGRNAVRLDIANHTAMPAGLLEGLRQGGGGGTEMHYTSEIGGAHRAELWDFGLPGRMVHAFEARMSLDDIVPSGLSIRADLSAEFAAPNPSINPTSED